jgi:SH3-like domain-containing protein/Tfp pilus assembly protein PilF
MKFQKTGLLALSLTISLTLLGGCAASQEPKPEESKPPQEVQAPELKLPNPQNADEIYAYAEGLERQGQEEKALGFYVQATQLDPDHLKSQIALAQLYTKFNRMDEAKVAYESILRLDREHAFVAQYKEARLKYYSALNIAQNEEYEKALQLVSQAPRNTPLDKEIDDSSKKWKAMLDSRQDDKKTDEILQQASLLAYKGKYKEAIDLAQTAPNASTNSTVTTRIEQWNKALQEKGNSVQPIGPTTQTPPSVAPAANSRLINSDQVNLRQSPYLYAESLTSLKRGTQVELIMDKAYESDGYQWSKVKTSDGTVGWVASNLLVTSLTATPPAATPLPTQPQNNPSATSSGETREINSDNVNIRRSPSLSGTLISRASDGTSVQLLNSQSVKADGYQWMHIRLPDGQEGWVAANFLGGATQVAPPAVKNTAAPAVKSPTTSSPNAVYANIQGTDVNVRSTPSTNGKIVGSVSAPAQVRLLPQKTVKQAGYTWHSIKLSNGTQGWVVERFLNISGATAAKPTAATASRRRYIRGDKVNIRKDASTASKVISLALEGTPVTLLSDKLVKSQGLTWAKIRLPNGEIGWVATQFIGR